MLNMITKNKIVCRNCKKNDFMKLIEKTFSNNTVHLLRICQHCFAGNSYHPKPMSIDKIGDFEMPFGKHKGNKLKSLPEDYLGWCIENLEYKMARKCYLEAKRRGMNLSGWESFEEQGWDS